MQGYSRPIQEPSCIYESQTASQKALWTFSRPFGERNDTAAPSDASDRLQTPAIASHRDLSAISKSAVWHSAGHSTVISENHS